MLPGIRADAVAAGDEQPAAFHRDATVGADVGAETRDHPRLAAGIHAAHHVRDAADSRRNDAYSTFESDQAIVRRRLKRHNERRREHSGSNCFIPHSTLPNC
jgi:hypothetical protein